MRLFVDWGVCELAWCLLAYILAASAVYVAAVWGAWHRAPCLAAGRTLFVTAHPDDECMFFAPAILALTAEADPASVYLLCLTRGNYRQEGETRARELWDSCARLGIPCDNVMLHHSSFFPDDPAVHWDSLKLAQVLRTHIATLDISCVVSFDEDGVSGHGNHIAIYRALLRLASRRLLPPGCRVFALDSVSVLRKYSAILDALPSLLLDRRVHLAPPSRRRQAVEAMHAHRSQMVWFRRLYVVASRYMLLNSFSEVMEDLSLEPE